MNSQAWSKDKLDRKASGEFLKKFLIRKFEENRDSFILNINTEWGFGKTFFLENLSLSLELDNYPVVYINAWKTDFSDEPLVAIISEINDGLSPYLKKSEPAKKLLSNTLNSAKKIIKPSLPIILSILTKKLTNLSIDEFNELLAEEDPGEQKDNVEESNKDLENIVSSVVSKAAEEALQHHNNKKDSILGFRTNLSDLITYIDKKLKKIRLPLFIFIDELDRCRPSYAIEVLENIKHLFGVSGVYFVVATDSKQLAYSINAIYGQSFESNRYLRRFFDQEYVLPTPNWCKFSDYLFEKNNLDQNKNLFSPLRNEHLESKSVSSEMFSKMAAYFDLSLRDQEQCCNILKSIILVHENTIFHLGYLLFLIMLKHKHDAFFFQYIKEDKDGRLKILEDMESKGEFIKKIAFQTIQQDDQTRAAAIKKRPFRVIISAYINILDKNISQIRSLNSAEEYLVSIYHTLSGSAPSSYPSNSPPEHNLNEYHDLVLQAGHLN